MCNVDPISLVMYTLADTQSEEISMSEEEQEELAMSDIELDQVLVCALCLGLGMASVLAVTGCFWIGEKTILGSFVL